MIPEPCGSGEMSPLFYAPCCPLIGLQHLTQATQCGTVDTKAGLRHWDLLWALNWLRGQAEIQTFKAVSSSI